VIERFDEWSAKLAEWRLFANMPRETRMDAGIP